jgi:hypothetical protein
MGAIQKVLQQICPGSIFPYRDNGLIRMRVMNVDDLASWFDKDVVDFWQYDNCVVGDRRKKMNSDLCIGIASRNGAYEVAALEGGRVSVVMEFPATRMGIEAIGGFLSSYGNRVRLAVAGVAALSLALALGNVPGRETFIVSSHIADQAAALAHYAEHTVWPEIGRQARSLTGSLHAAPPESIPNAIRNLKAL